MLSEESKLNADYRLLLINMSSIISMYRKDDLYFKAGIIPKESISMCEYVLSCKPNNLS